MEDKNVRGVPVRLVRGMVLVMPVQLEPPQPFCAAGRPSAPHMAGLNRQERTLQLRGVRYDARETGRQC